MTAPRLLHPDSLPRTLWDRGDQCVLIPEVIGEPYRAAIHRHALLELALARTGEDSPVGGLTQQATDAHFAQQFDGSLARAELAMLDPLDDVSHVSDCFVRLLSGGKVAILDIPSGAGALALSLLATAAELRARGTLPRHPLYVTVVAGELSRFAQQYASELFAEVELGLRAQAIWVNHVQVLWDATDALSTSALVSRFIRESIGAERRQVVVSNFSGFLSRSGNQRKAEPQLEEIFRYAAEPKTSAAWLEPQTNAAVSSGGVLSGMARAVRTVMSRFAKIVAPSRARDDGVTQTGASFVPVLRPNARARVRLAVLRFELERESS